MTANEGVGHEVVSHDRWIEARSALLAQEKEFTRARDALSAARRALPWERVDKAYAFTGENGTETLPQLFAGRGQLVVYHFMFDPAWQAGCKSCSFWADNFNGIDVHLAHRDTTLLAVSRAPYEKLAAYRKRMGWSFKWMSCAGSDFNYDFSASYTPAQLAGGDTVFNYARAKPYGEDVVAISVFVKGDDNAVYHSYSCYSRGVDMLNGAYHYLDLTPRGRDEGGTGGNPQAWVRRRDEYEG